MTEDHWDIYKDPHGHLRVATQSQDFLGMPAPTTWLTNTHIGYPRRIPHRWHRLPHRWRLSSPVLLPAAKKLP